jgi:carbon monoxide dehydrogenase subunit G
MQIDSTFSVVAPIDNVWDTLMDFQRVAGCVPGAQILNKLSDDAYQVGMKVKLGPVTMQYKGQMAVLERDAAEHRAVLQGRAQETRGQGTAEATVTLRLAEAERTTTGTVTAELNLSGKAAAMGKSVIGGVTEQMMALFAANLQALLTEPAPESEEAPAAAPVAAAVSAPEPPSSVPPSDNSLNALSLAKGMITEQFNSPGRRLGLLAAVAFCAYRLGRRAGLRSART